MSESAPSRLARLLALVPWLRAHQGVTIQRAAEHFGVSAEQLTTDLWQLIVCGIPGYGPDQLVDIQFWDDDRIHVLDPMTLERPLRLTGEEAASLVVALRVLTQIPGDHDRAALRSAIGKLELAAVPTPDVDVRISGNQEIIDSISAAIANQSGLEIEYSSAHDDSITTRVIAPLGSFTVDGYAYIEAWCDMAQGIRTFRLDRIISATSAMSPAGAPPSTPDREVAGPSALAVDAALARVAVDPRAAWIWDSDPIEPDGGSWSNTPDGDPWPTGTMPYASTGYLLRFCLGRAGHVLLLEPADLRTSLGAVAGAKLARLRAPNPPPG
jgi:proteasome accessory factor C